MKKILALIVSIVFLSVVITQIANSVNANPNWKPWENTSPSNYPIISVVSPVEGGNYSSNDVWLNITVTKPSWLNTTNYQIKFISYAVYTVNIDTPYSRKLEMRDSLDVADEPSSFNFSVNIAGLEDGAHTLYRNVNGVDGDGEFNLIAFTDFTVYTPEPESFSTSIVIASAVTVAVVLIGLSLLLYGIKRK
jgi:hypothetical protein